jgi:4-amino-4-deoxy-L-arabinose transferase-like glycosyltransferase
MLGAPAFLWQMFSAYADLATALYASLGLFALAYAVQEGNRRWLWLSGALMGFALATKYTALLTAGLWGLVGLLWLARAGQAKLIPTLVGAGLLAGAIGAPWYIRNYLWTGNPVYPFAYEIFGGKKLEPSASGRLPPRPAQVRAGTRACAAAARAVEPVGEPCAIY